MKPKITFQHSILPILFFILFFHSFNFVNGQNISGKLQIGEEPAMFYAVILYDQDTTLLKGTLTDSLGYFNINNIDSGNYFLTGKGVGLKEIILASFEFSKNENKKLGIIKMDNKDNEILLNEVVVKYTLPTIRRTNDKIIVNIANSILAEGNTITEILNYIPGVLVDPRGDLSVNRQGGVSIFIDDRIQDRLRSSAEILQNIDPNTIDKIEVYTNPPSRFDAQGSSVINIITKKNKKISTVNASFGHSFYQYNGEIGDPYRIIGSANLNYNLGKLKTYSQLSLGESFGKQFSSNERSYVEDDIVIRDNGEFETLARSLRYGTGLQYDIKENHAVLLDFVGLTSIGQLPTSTFNNQRTFRNGISSDTSSISQNLVDRNYDNYSLGLSYWFDNKSGIKRDVQLLYSLKNITNYQTIDNPLMNPSQSDINRQNNYETSSFIFNNSQKAFDLYDLKYGTKITRLDFHEEVLQNQNLFLFNYNEFISAAYSEMSGSYKSFNWQVGARLEGTIWESQGPEVSLNANNNYLSFFPSTSLSIKLDSLGKSLNLSYSRRISRPTVSELNPTQRLTGPFSSQTGNAFSLLPRIYNNFELSSFLGDLYITAWYRRTENQRAYVPINIDELDILYQVISVEKAQSIGGLISYKHNFGIWNPKSDITVFYDSESLINGQSVGSFGYNLAFTNNFRVNKQINSSLDFFYRSQTLAGYNEVSSILNSSLAMRWTPQSNNWIVGVRLNDIFNTSNFYFKSIYSDFINTNQVLNGGRELTFSLTYKFKMGNDFSQKRLQQDNETFRVN